MALGVEDYLIRGLQGHVAVYAMVNDARLHGREPAAAFGFVASEAACRQDARITLLLMHIVASCTGYRCGTKAATAGELLDLVAMDIGRRIRSSVRDRQIAGKVLAGGKGKGRGAWCARSRMAESAQIHLSLGGKLSRVHDIR
jgi:hypothetical protein